MYSGASSGLLRHLKHWRFHIRNFVPYIASPLEGRDNRRRQPTRLGYVCQTAEWPTFYAAVGGRCVTYLSSTDAE